MPFVLPRIFRPTVLDVYSLTNVELGTCFSIYGIVAFVSYVLGGSFADKYNPRLLMSVSLILTAAGGIYMSTYPSFVGLTILYGYWGFTTIFLFWAAMIKATRVWGGVKKQGIAFGLLDSGRGLVSYAFGGLGILIFSAFLVSDIEIASFIERQVAYKQVVLVSSAIIAFIGLLVFLFIKNQESTAHTHQSIGWKQLLKNYGEVLKYKSVWLLMIIILCSYTGYKITDFYSQFANEIMGYDEVVSAGIGKDMLGIRIIIGIIIGLLADRTKSSLMMILGFVITIIGAIIFTTGIVDSTTVMLFWFSIILTATGVYAFRTLYFSAIQEGEISIEVTGTAVGLISLVGYTPDIFMGPVTGYFIDGSPGAVGFQKIFLMLAIFALIGLIASIIFYRYSKKSNTQST